MTGINDDTARLAAILRDHLRATLAEDLERRLSRNPFRPIYAWDWTPEDGRTATEADLDAIRGARQRVAADIENNAPDDLVWDDAATLLRQHGLPEHLHHALAIGLLEVARTRWDRAEGWSNGTTPLILMDDTEAAHVPPPASSEAAPLSPPASPHASALVEPFFARRERNGTRAQVMGQERTTLRLFVEIARDRPTSAYGRGDVTRFLDTLRDMPSSYGKSPKDKDKAVEDLIAEAEEAGAARLTDKTVKRHLTALAQFFRFAMDHGHISNAQRAELVDDHRFDLDGNAREQRAAWEPEELARLFKSPVWTGRDPVQITKPGPEIVRDAKFWLPLLALFHGARLEELADLYRRDVDCIDGTWVLRIVATKEDKAAGKKKRTLKTDSASRILPVHSEIMRLGFIEYVTRTAPNTDDPLFPDLPPQGKDQRRGARFTRDFRYYREQVGVYRPGVGMHSFRHNANTRLRDVITDWQQERHVAYLLGHSQGGGEGRGRYDKGPGLKAVAATLALLRFPEVDLSHLHVEAGAATAAPCPASPD